MASNPGDILARPGEEPRKARRPPTGVGANPGAILAQEAAAEAAADAVAGPTLANFAAGDVALFGVDARIIAVPVALGVASLLGVF